MWQLLVALSTWVALGSTQSCTYSQVIRTGQTFYASSPNYPNNYPKGVTCTWTASCPDGYCRANCYDISLPSSQSCSLDRLLISKTGDPLNSQTYCGVGTTTVISTGTQLSIRLVTSPSSPGGRFSCELTSVPTTTVPTCSCGYKKTNRIVGGTETGINEYPMMAGLASATNYNILCGAVIIDKKYLMTAAHCVTGSERLLVVVGEHNVLTNDSPATRIYEIAAIKVHPQYNSNNYDNDVALIMTKTDMVFSDRVGPVCLPFKFRGSSFANTVVTTLGWGSVMAGAPPSDYLQKVNLNVITDTACRQKGQSPTVNQMCTFTQGKDACQMDSGGPLLYTDPSTGWLHSVGIVSHGTYCGTSAAGINTMVTQILDWVVYNTPDANYCVK